MNYKIIQSLLVSNRNYKGLPGIDLELTWDYQVLPHHTQHISLTEGAQQYGHIRRHIHHLYLTEGARKS